MQVYGKKINAADFPVLAGSFTKTAAGNVTVIVSVKGSLTGLPAKVTATPPVAATQSTTLGTPGSVPRNQCVTMLGYPRLPCDCGYPYIYGKFANGSTTFLNASASIGADGTSIELTAPAPDGFQATASSYGRASWPMTLFFAAEGGNPVIPWYSNFTTTKPWQPPTRATDLRVPAVIEQELAWRQTALGSAVEELA